MMVIEFLKWKELKYFLEWCKKAKNKKTKIRLWKHTKKLLENKKNYSVK